MAVERKPSAWTALTATISLDKIRGKAGRSLRLENRALGVRSSDESVLVGGSTAGSLPCVRKTSEARRLVNGLLVSRTRGSLVGEAPPS
jgi:hypothetical protein